MADCADVAFQLVNACSALAALAAVNSEHNLKTWALGVYHGLRDKHLQSYLDEFVFRFNRRRSRHAAFSSLFTIALAAKPVTYKMLIEPDTAE